MELGRRAHVSLRAPRNTVATLMAVAMAVAPGPAVAADPGPAAAAAVTGSWPQEGYGPGNTGYNPAEPVLNRSSVATLRERWSVTPVPGPCLAVQPPVVAGGRAFIADGEGVGAYHAVTGARLWHDATAFSDAAGLHLAIAGDVLVGSAYGCYSQSDPDGFLVAFDAATGERRWQVRADPPFRTLAVDAGTVVVSGSSASDEPTVSAYRLRDGAHRWTRTAVRLPAPVVAGGRLVLVARRGTSSMAVSLATGAVVWRSAEPWSVVAASPSGEHVYATTPTGDLVAVRTVSGRPAWSAPDAGGVVTADTNRVYIARGRTVAAYRARTGDRLWAVDLPGTAGRPIRAGGMVYVTVPGLPMAILNPTTGKSVATGELYRGARLHPVVAGGTLYTTDGTTLRAYTPDPGT
jgi:outer membrane protein assembly factor BamB